MSTKTPQCVWTPRGGYSEGTCGRADSMASYSWKFCPYCGKPLKLGAEAPHA